MNLYLLDDSTKRLFFIGDVHGQYQKLIELLEYAGYDGTNLNSRYGTGKVVFIGDLIDNLEGNGADHQATLNTVKKLVDNGLAYCLLGNHEFNAIGWTLAKENGEFARPHSKSNRRQHELFLQQVGENSAEHRKWIEWFKTLPLFIDFGPVRAIHACWHHASVERLIPYLNQDNSLKQEYWPDAFNQQHELYDLCETLLKGPEMALPEGYSFCDKTGKERHHIRVRWWRDEAQTYRDIAQVQADELDNIPDMPLPVRQHNEKQRLPVVVGHYTLAGTPELLSDKVICVDYNAGNKEGHLVGYSMELDDGNQDIKPPLSNRGFVFIRK